MQRLSALALLALLASCSREDPALQEKLDKITAKLDGIEKKLAAQPAARQPQPLPPRPMVDAKATYSVPVDGDALRGPAVAPITIVEAAEFACPHCRRGMEIVKQIEKAYPGKVRFAFKNYVVHPATATTPALGVCAANKQGKGWPFIEALWNASWEMPAFEPAADVPMPKFLGPDKLAEPSVLAVAGKIPGLNVDKFKADMNGEACKAELAAGKTLLESRGVTGTPAFFVNGRFVSGAQPLANFKTVIDEELARYEQAIKDGAKPETYYASLVDKGLKQLQMMTPPPPTTVRIPNPGAPGAPGAPPTFAPAKPGTPPPPSPTIKVNAPAPVPPPAEKK